MHATRAVAVLLLVGAASCSSGSGAQEVRVQSPPLPVARPVVVTNPWALPADVTTTTTTEPPSTTTTTTTTAPPRPPVETPPDPEPPPEPTVEDPVGGIEAIIVGAFGSRGRAALRVASCESGLDPTQTNGPVRGLFQIHEVHARDWANVIGRSYWKSWDDPVANATYAAVLSNGGRDWSDWSCKP